MLNVVRHPGPETTPLLIAHGLFGSARNWGVLSKRLSEERPVHTVDMRNHGESGWDDAHGYPDLADDLANIIAGEADVLGHSMGGKAAMCLALAHPHKVRRLVVVDIAPVAYSHTQQELIDAMRALDLAAIGTRGDADRQMEETVAEPGVRAFLLQSLDVKERRWRLNLDVLSREMERIVGFPDVDGQFEGPALFLSGSQSDYVQPQHQERILSLFPAAEFAEIEGAGHWLHAEKPRETEAAVRDFLKD